MINEQGNSDYGKGAELLAGAARASGDAKKAVMK
jgi:hypothetical protein